MIELIVKIIKFFVLKCKQYPRFSTMVAIVIPTISYVLITNHYIVTTGKYLTFEIPIFQNCTITFHTPIKISSYKVEVAQDVVKTNEDVSVNRRILDQELVVLSITNTLNLVQTTDAAQKYRIQIVFDGDQECEIESIKVDDVNVNIKSFLKNDLKGAGQVVYFRYVRKLVANVLYSFNDVVSNFILTILTVGIIALFIKVIKMEIAAYFYSDKCFKAFLMKSLKITNINSKDECKKAYALYAARWYTSMIRFKFFQILGPAIGFILTVSSLIAALHPALHAKNDIGAFINGIHVAMISTFLGLLLRIAALEGSRVNDVLLDRVELYLGE